MRRTGRVVFLPLSLLLFVLLAAAAFAQPVGKADLPPTGEGGFEASDFQPGQPVAASMTIFEDKLVVGTQDWINGGEVWSYDTASWSRLAMEGFGDPDNVGVVSLAAFDELLYAGTMNWESGCQLWRFNGASWTLVKAGGFGDQRNHAVTSLAVFDEWLYAGVENAEQGCEVWRTWDGDTWTQVKSGGFGNANNTDVLSLAVFGNRLYAGTHNPAEGCEVWRTGDGTTWSQMSAGGFGDIFNEGASSLSAYSGSLYAGTWNNNSGCDVWTSPDGTTWSQMNADGFGDENNVDATSLAVFKGRLYAGTYNVESGCQLWSWAETADWVQVNAGGFGDLNNIDAVCLQVYNYFLYAGTLGWEAGCEVWRTAGAGGPPYTDWTQVNQTGFTGATWYLAEGATDGGFETWVLVQNPGDDVARATLTYMTESGETPGPVLDIPPKTRMSVNVAETVQTMNVSTKVTADKPVVVERSLYYNNRTCATGSVGATDPAPTWYLAEGATDGGFETWILVQNPGDDEAAVLLTYYTEEGVVFGPDLTIAPKSRISVNVADTVQTFNVSTQVTSDKPVVVERALYYGDRACANGSIGVSDPAPTWYLAEGASLGGFETWILVQNPDDEVANVTLTYMTDAGEQAGPVLAVPPQTRVSVNVADTVQTWGVSTKVDADKPVVVERALYYGNRVCANGSIGVSEPATDWYLAEGSSMGGFETWVLVQNPGDEVANVTLTYMTDAGEQAGPVLAVPPKTRVSVNVADTVRTFNVSTQVTSDKPVVVERALYFGGRICSTGSAGFNAR